MLRRGVAVVITAVPELRVIFEDGRNQVVVRPPGQVVVFRAQTDQQIVPRCISDLAADLDEAPESFLHGRLGLRIETSGAVRTSRTKEAEDAHVVAQREVGPRRVLAVPRRKTRLPRLASRREIDLGALQKPRVRLRHFLVEVEGRERPHRIAPHTVRPA